MLLLLIFWMVVEAGLGEQSLVRITEKELVATTVASWRYRGASAKLNAMDGLGEPETPGTDVKKLK